MRTLVTGVTGAVGPHVIAELEKHHELKLFTRRPVESPHPVVVGDLRSPEACKEALAGVEAVVHLAGNSEPAPEAVEVNVLGTYHLMDAAREVGVRRFIFASTNCVYGHCYRATDRDFRLEFLPIDESHGCYPEDNYGLSKVLDERMLATYSEVWNLETAALRLNWVWGPEEIQWREGMEALDLERFAPFFWAYVDARDTARAFRQALEEENLPSFGVYNISAADHMADEETGELLDRFYPGAERRAELAGRASLFAWRAAERAFGYRPRYSWKDGWSEATVG